jgi:hypothetical protein
VRLLSIEPTAQHRDDALAAPQRFVDFPGTDLGLGRIRRQHEDDDVALQDELAEPLLPLLRAVDALAVDGDLKALRLQHRDELVGEVEIAAGVGNEDLELVAGRPGGRSHSNAPNCN